jgi:hypothetical protein
MYQTSNFGRIPNFWPLLVTDCLIPILQGTQQSHHWNCSFLNNCQHIWITDWSLSKEAHGIPLRFLTGKKEEDNGWFLLAADARTTSMLSCMHIAACLFAIPFATLDRDKSLLASTQGTGKEEDGGCVMYRYTRTAFEPAAYHTCPRMPCKSS